MDGCVSCVPAPVFQIFPFAIYNTAGAGGSEAGAKAAPVRAGAPLLPPPTVPTVAGGAACCAAGAGGCAAGAGGGAVAAGADADTTAAAGLCR